MKPIPGYPGLQYRVKQSYEREYLEIYKPPTPYPVFITGSIGKQFENPEQEAIEICKLLDAK